MFMKLSDINEAQYASHKRGSLHWMLDKFFDGPNIDKEYWIDENRFIAIFDGDQIIGLQLLERRKQIGDEPELFIKLFTEHSGREGKSRYTSADNVAKLLRIYSSKRLV